MNTVYRILILFRSCSCFISEVGVFFGAFLVPIILIILFNACIFIASSYVVIRLKFRQQKSNLARKGCQKQHKFPMSIKDTCKLVALLAGFMFLLGLSWIILLFTVVGADTNIYAAFAIQWLFVFFNSLQGFFLFVFFVALNRDARILWYNFLCPCLKSKKGAYSSRIKHSTIFGNTAITKLSTQREVTFDTMKSAVKKHKFEETVVVNYASTINETDIDDAPDLLVDLITSPPGEDDTTVKTLSKNLPEIRIKRSTTIRKTHDIETAEVTFDASGSEDEETSL